MKLTASKTQLIEALTATLAVAPSRSTLPVLENTLLSAIDGRLTLKATDLDLHMATGFPCDIAEEGSICLPSKRLANLARELPTESFSLEVRDGTATLASGNLRTKLHGLPAGEFPSQDGEDFTDEIELPAPDLLAGIRRIAFAASNDESRYVLNGILLEGGDETLLVATDGRRLAKVKLDVELRKGLQAIIPNKAVAAMQKILGDDEALLELGESFAVIYGQNAILRTRLIAGNFPNWRQVLPTNLPNAVEIEREALLAAVKRVGLMASEKALSINLDFGPDLLTVTASSPEVGEASETLAMRCGLQSSVTLNVQYLREALQHVPEDTLTWRMNDGESPVLLSAGAWEYVLMPMRKG